MLRKLRPHLTYANVAATLALVIAVGGGTAWAAQKIRTRNIAYHAVTASKVNYNAITASKVKNGSLSGKEIRDGSLVAADFGVDQLPRGEKGEKGDPATSLHGTVSALGALTFGSGVTAVAPGDDGEYAVTFDRDVSRCSVVATVATSLGGSVSAQHAAGAPQQVAFTTRTPGGIAADRPFGFAVFC